MWWRQPGRRRALRRAFQNTWLLAGSSPWPVVAMAMRTTGCCNSCFCTASTTLLLRPGVRLTYKTDGVQGSDMGVKVQALGEAAQFFRHVLGASCFRAIEDQGRACLRACCHGGCRLDSSVI